VSEGGDGVEVAVLFACYTVAGGEEAKEKKGWAWGGQPLRRGCSVAESVGSPGRKRRGRGEGSPFSVVWRCLIVRCGGKSFWRGGGEFKV